MRVCVSVHVSLVDVRVLVRRTSNTERRPTLVAGRAACHRRVNLLLHHHHVAVFLLVRGNVVSQCVRMLALRSVCLSPCLSLSFSLSVCPSLCLSLARDVRNVVLIITS